MTDCTARDSGMVCTKTSPHPGERHTCDFGSGAWTWGYELSDADRADIAEDQRHVRLADRNEDHL